MIRQTIVILAFSLLIFSCGSPDKTFDFDQAQSHIDIIKKSNSKKDINHSVQKIKELLKHSSMSEDWETILNEYVEKGEKKVRISAKKPSKERSILSHPLQQKFFVRGWALLGNNSHESLSLQFRKIGLKVAMFRERDLIIPPKLRFTKITIERLLTETASYNGGLTIWFSDNKKRAIFFKKVDKNKITAAKINMKSNNIKICQEAIWKAGWLAQPDILNALIPFVNSKNETLRLQAVRSLRQIGYSSVAIYLQEEALPFLFISMLENKYPPLLALGLIKSEKSKRLIGSFLQSSDIFTVTSALRALNEFPIEEVSLIKKNIYNKFQSDFQLNSIVTIHRLRFSNEKDHVEFIKTKINDSNKIIRDVAVESLGLLGDKEAMKFIKKVLAYPKGGSHYAALKGLEGVNASKAFLMIKRILNSTEYDDGTKALALKTLGVIHHSKAAALIEKGLMSQNKYIQAAALKALGCRASKNAIKFIKIHLKNSHDLFVCKAGIEALYRIGGEESFKQIKLALDDKKKSTSALTVLGEIGGFKSLSLVKSEAYKSPYGRIPAIEALNKIGGKEAYNIIKGFLNDKSPWVRFRAIEALEKNGGIKALPLIKEFTYDKDNYVREIVAVSLGKIGGRKSQEFLLKWAKSELNKKVLDVINKQLLHIKLNE